MPRSQVSLGGTCLDRCANGWIGARPKVPFKRVVAVTLSGAQIRYLIKSPTYGCLGVLAFSSGTWALKDRDHSIGWNDAARMANLKYVVTNDRFLIVPESGVLP